MTNTVWPLIVSSGSSGSGGGVTDYNDLTNKPVIPDISDLERQSLHALIKVASIDTDTYADTDAAVATYSGSVSDNTAIAFTAPAVILNIMQDGSYQKLRDNTSGFEIINETDNLRYAWSGTSTAWEATTSDVFSGEYGDLRNTPDIDSIQDALTHTLTKVANIDQTVYANVAAAVAAYSGAVSDNTLIAFANPRVVLELMQDGSHKEVFSNTNGREIVNNVDNLRYKWDGSSNAWIQTTPESFSGRASDLAGTVDYSSQLSNTPNIEPVFAGDEVPLVIIMGQSNTDGRGNTSDLPDIETSFNGEVRIFDKPITREPASASTNRVDNGAWKDYVLGDMVVSPRSPASGAFGVEFSLARRWAEESYAKFGNKPLHIVKFAVGNTSLGPTNSGIDRNWTTDSDQLRELFIEYVWTPALRALQTEGLKPKCLGIIWGQGEGDGYSTSQSALYETNLTSFMQDIRTRTGFPNAKFQIVQLGNFDAGDKQSTWDVVKQAQKDVVDADSNSHLIVTDGSTGLNQIDRYLDGVGAGNIHFSSVGFLWAGNLMYDNLDFFGEPLDEPWDFVLAGSANPVGAPLNLEAIGGTESERTRAQKYGTLQSVMFPTTGDAVPAITWVRSGEILERPTHNRSPSPATSIDALDGHSDIEIIFKLGHDGEPDAKPIFFIRSSGNNKTDPSNGYIFMVRETFKMRLYSVVNGSSYTTLSYNQNPSQQPGAGDLYWYRITAIGNELTFYNSPDGKTWTQQIQETNNDHSSGDLVLSYFNGYVDKAVGNVYMANTAFTDIYARRL